MNPRLLQSTRQSVLTQGTDGADLKYLEDRADENLVWMQPVPFSVCIQFHITLFPQSVCVCNEVCCQLEKAGVSVKIWEAYANPTYST